MGLPGRRHDQDLLALVLLTAAATATILLAHGVVVRVVLVIPLGLLAPGYALSEAIFAAVPREPAPRLMLVGGLSLVTLTLGGMALNELPGGIRSGPWAILLLLVVLVSAAVARRRRERSRHSGVSPMPIGAGSLPRVGIVNLAVLSVALLLGAGALVASRLPRGAANVVGYETLSVRPVAGENSVDIRLASGREQTAAYGLSIDVGSREVQRRTVILAPGATDTFRVLLGAGRRPRRVSASAVLIGGHERPHGVSLTVTK